MPIFKKNGDGRKIVKLVKRLSFYDGTERENALKTLIGITGRDFGYDAADWMNWYTRNRDGNRLMWTFDSLEEAGYDLRARPMRKVIPGLINALRDACRGVRGAAYFLLRHFTGQEIPFPVCAGRPTRENHVILWISWWDTEERRKKLGIRNGE
jgi:hypothetical protein